MDTTERRTPAMLKRQQALELLKATPDGQQEIRGIFQRVVLLPGEFLPAGIPMDAMISDIVDVEFMRP